MRKLTRQHWILIAWYLWVAVLLATIAYYFFA
jgi:hypothetical protein